MVGARARRQPGEAEARAFDVASTGGRASLTDYPGENVLPYFNEGVGCNACFYQQARIEADAARFEEAGIRVVPVVVNPADAVRQEMARFGIRTPFLIDPDGSVSATHGTRSGFKCSSASASGWPRRSSVTTRQPHSRSNSRRVKRRMAGWCITTSTRGCPSHTGQGTRSKQS